MLFGGNVRPVNLPKSKRPLLFLRSSETLVRFDKLTIREGSGVNGCRMYCPKPDLHRQQEECTRLI